MRLVLGVGHDEILSKMCDGRLIKQSIRHGDDPHQNNFKKLKLNLPALYFGCILHSWINPQLYKVLLCDSKISI